MKIEIEYVNTKEGAKWFLEKGYCPIECSFGGESVVDGLEMDHHGSLSGLEPISIRAYRDLYGFREKNPYFVVTRTPDPDAIFTILSLSGMIDKDKWASLASLIAKHDLEPIGLNIPVMWDGDLFLFLHSFSNSKSTQESWVEHIYFWCHVLSCLEENRHDLRYQPFLKAALDSEKERIQCGLNDLEEKSFSQNGILVLKNPENWAFDVWYRRRCDLDLVGPVLNEEFNSPMGWMYPIVIAYHKKYTIGTPNIQVAECLFGPGGLKNVFKALGVGWGGRESIGGSPDGMEVTPEKTNEIISIISGMMK